MKMSGQEARFSDLVQLTYLDAPYACNEADEAKQYEVIKKFFPKSRHGPYREWFNADVLKGGSGPEYVSYARCKDALDAVEHALVSASPPFDGLMGFSQGGSLALWIATLQAHGKLRPEVPTLRFVWIQSARLPRDHSCKGLFDTQVPIRAFVTFTEDDDDVRPHETRALIAKLEPAPLVVTRAKGGHGVMNPRVVSDDDIDRIRAFFKDV